MCDEGTQKWVAGGREESSGISASGLRRSPESQRRQHLASVIAVGKCILFIVRLCEVITDTKSASVPFKWMKLTTYWKYMLHKD